MLNRYVIPDMPSADQLLPYLRQIDEKRWYSNFGPLVTQFEKRLTAHLSALDKNAQAGPLALTTLMTCYHALQIGLQLFRMPANAQVLLPAVTFPACPLAVRHAGAEPVLADVDGATWHLTPEVARRAAEKMPIHAIMPVAVYGVPVPVEEWDKFSDDTGIPVIIDAAAALEAQPIPKKGLVAHSLHATKPFSIGEGGVLVARRSDWIEEARCISNFGTQLRIALQDGSNAKMSEYHGAVALAQLDRWDEVKQKRRDGFARFRAVIEKAALGVGFQQGIERAIASVIMLQSPATQATHIVNALTARGIAAHRMYLPPLYHHPYFANLKIVNNKGLALSGTSSLDQKVAWMENCEAMQRSVFGLPFHAFMSGDDMDYVAQTLAEVMDKPRAS